MKMPTSSGCSGRANSEGQAHIVGQGDQQSLQGLLDALAEQRIVVPLDRMDLVLHEFTVLQRQRALINGVVESEGLSGIHTVISRSRGAL
ncbi:hypothetical protein SB816_19630 [Achromobacter sp. SIMBA_011]|uniref:hypothetical protein n=1 Tax=Achromobacter TaxID=222 RepID=UPI0012F48FD1|nr:MULTISPECIES: hypothetical protein [Achromobacter]MCU6619403.1 hypothetical protein [Achromobacter mucicolens]MCZ8410913.1 hypothetical protein [Achromobacter dolens]